MEKKKYRLLKDLLVSKKGDIFVWDEQHKAYGNRSYGDAAYTWSEKQISTDNDFEEIVEGENPPLFTAEQIKKIMEDNYDKSMDLPAFYHNLLREFGLYTRHDYPLEPKDCESQKPLEHENVQKLREIKKQAELFLSKAKVATEPKKEWEIVTAYNTKKDGGSLDLNNCTIKAVRRLSDGEMFIVGDEIEVLRGENAKIIRFGFLGEGVLSAVTEKIIMPFNLCKKKAKDPLFTSEDGVPIYEDSNAWGLSRNGSIGKFRAMLKYHSNFEDTKWFSSEEVAKDYRRVHHIGDKYKPKKVEVSDFGTYQEMYPVIPETWYQFMVSDRIPVNKFREISQAIEDILNK